MNEKATVIKLQEDKIIVSCSSNSGCKNCATCSSSGKKREISVLNSKQINLKVGDDVQINLPASQTILSSFLVLILPLIFFIISYVLSGQIKGAGDGLRALIGIGGMFFAFLLSFLFSKIMKKVFMPHVESKIK